MNDLLTKIAPTIATILGGPLAGMAVEAIGSALGMKDATQDKIKDIFESGKLTGDQVVAIKQAELAMQTKLEELKIKPEEIAAGDRDSARKMQSETKSTIPGTLAVGVTLGFFGILAWLIAVGKPKEGGDVLMVMLGSLGTAWTSIVQFYFGSSASSKAKDDTLAAIAKS